MHTHKRCQLRWRRQSRRQKKTNGTTATARKMDGKETRLFARWPLCLFPVSACAYFSMCRLFFSLCLSPSPESRGTKNLLNVNIEAHSSYKTAIFSALITTSVVPTHSDGGAQWNVTLRGHSFSSSFLVFSAHTHYVIGFYMYIYMCVCEPFCYVICFQARK